MVIGCSLAPHTSLLMPLTGFTGPVGRKLPLLYTGYQNANGSEAQTQRQNQVNKLHRASIRTCIHMYMHA